MKGLTFKKGIHPNYHKEETAGKAIEVLMPNGELVFPMSQHIGAPCTPLVKKGDKVYVGQKIGEANGFVSAAIHSSVSGTVKIVEPRMSARGIKVMSVVVESDGLFEENPEIEKVPLDVKSLTKETLIERVKASGLVGMGGATFPTHVKLSTPPDQNVEFIIVNAAECEPYITSDHRVMLEQGEELIEGLEILLKVFDKAQAVVGIENNKRDAFDNIAALAKGHDRIKVVTLETKYPQGSEKHLIYAVTGREVPSGKLPINVGCIVHNVDSIVAINRAVKKDQPIMRRIVTLSGSGIQNPCNVEVKLGTSIRELLEYAKWDEEKTVKMIEGGPMMGGAVCNIDAPVTKGTSAILCFTEKECSPITTSACIRCGKCVEVCPMGLVPNTLHRASLHHHQEAFLEAHGMDCIECGCCSYTCPAKRDIVQSIRTMKAAVRAKK